MTSIETERLILRPFTLDDVDNHHRAVYGDAGVMRYMPGGLPRTREQTERVIAYFMDHWDRHGFGAWAVVEQASGSLIGQCGLNTVPDTHPLEVEVLYALAQSAWGQGFATEAARASLRYGFEQVRLDRIIALAAPDNAASRHVMDKLGMKYLGIRPYYHDKLATCEIRRAGFKAEEASYQVKSTPV